MKPREVCCSFAGLPRVMDEGLCSYNHSQTQFLLSCNILQAIEGFPGDASGKEPACQCRRHKKHGFDPWVGKIPWSGKWQPTPIFLPRKSHGQRSLAGYGPHGCKKLDTTEATQHIWACMVLLLLLLSCFSRVRPCATPEMVAYQAPPSMGFSRQEYWSGLPFPSPDIDFPIFFERVISLTIFI